LSDLELELVESLVESLVEEQEQDLELVELVELVELAAAVVAFVTLVPLVEPFGVASVGSRVRASPTSYRSEQTTCFLG